MEEYQEIMNNLKELIANLKNKVKKLTIKNKELKKENRELKNNTCRHCDNDVGTYCEGCYQKLISENLKLQLDLASLKGTDIHKKIEDKIFNSNIYIIEKIKEYSNETFIEIIYYTLDENDFNNILNELKKSDGGKNDMFGLYYIVTHVGSVEKLKSLLKGE